MAAIVSQRDKGSTIITHVFCITAFAALSFALLAAFTIGSIKGGCDEEEA